MERGRYAVVTTHDRPDDVRDSVRAILPQVDEVCVIDNRSMSAPDLPGTTVVRNEDDPPNISALWNIGLDWAEKQARLKGFDSWDVAVLNDDAIVPPDWFEVVTTVMRDYGAVLGSVTDTPLSAPLLFYKPEPINLFHRFQGFAWVLDGGCGLRLDEELVWWYGDDDLDWRARQFGGTVVVPGLHVEHRHPNGSTNADPRLTKQAGWDRATFVAKWGRAPW